MFNITVIEICMYPEIYIKCPIFENTLMTTVEFFPHALCFITILYINHYNSPPEGEIAWPIAVHLSGIECSPPIYQLQSTEHRQYLRDT